MLSLLPSLLLVGIAHSAFVATTFLPPVNFPGLGGSANTATRKFGFQDQTNHFPTFLNMSRVAHICETFEFQTDGVIPSPTGTMNKTGVFCRATDVSGGSNATECDDLDTRPCSIEETSGFTHASVQSYRIQRAFEFSWTIGDSIPDNWWTDEFCDVSEECYFLPSNMRAINPNCTKCAFDVSASFQCFHASGLPAIPYVSEPSTAQDLVPCLDTNNCNYYCCSEQRRVDSFRIDLVNTCTFIPPVLSTTISTACGSGARLGEVCVASSALEFNTTDLSLRVVDEHSYMCSYVCDFPCITALNEQLSECTVTDGVEMCNPTITNFQTGGVHDKKCKVDFRSTNYCPGKEQAVSFKNIDRALALGQNPYYTLAEANVYRTLRRCSDTDYFACDPPRCGCFFPTGCVDHVNCSSAGTLFTSEYPPSDPYYTAPQCICKAGMFENFCHVTKAETDPLCSNGQDTTAASRLIP